MDREEQEPAYPLEVLAETTDILLGFLEDKDEGKSHEAITILLMQGLNLLGANLPRCVSSCPYSREPRPLIDASDPLPEHIGRPRASERSCRRSSRSSRQER